MIHSMKLFNFCVTHLLQKKEKKSVFFVDFLIYLFAREIVKREIFYFICCIFCVPSYFSFHFIFGNHIFDHTGDDRSTITKRMFAVPLMYTNMIYRKQTNNEICRYHIKILSFFFGCCEPFVWENRWYVQNLCLLIALVFFVVSFIYFYFEWSICML